MLNSNGKQKAENQKNNPQLHRISRTGNNSILLFNVAIFGANDQYVTNVGHSVQDYRSRDVTLKHIHTRYESQNWINCFVFVQSGSREERWRPISQQHIDNKVKQNLRIAIDYQQVLRIKILYCSH